MKRFITAILLISILSPALAYDRSTALTSLQKLYAYVQNGNSGICYSLAESYSPTLSELYEQFQQAEQFESAGYGDQGRYSIVAQQASVLNDNFRSSGCTR